MVKLAYFDIYKEEYKQKLEVELFEDGKFSF